MILRLTLTTAHLVGESAGEWHGSGSGLVAPDHTPVLHPGFPIPVSGLATARTTQGLAQTGQTAT